MKSLIIASGMTDHPRSKLRTKRRPLIRSVAMNRIVPFQLKNMVLLLLIWWQRLLASRMKLVLRCLLASVLRVNIHVLATMTWSPNHLKSNKWQKPSLKAIPEKKPSKTRKQNWLRRQMMPLLLFRRRLAMLWSKSPSSKKKFPEVLLTSCQKPSPQRLK